MSALKGFERGGYGTYLCGSCGKRTRNTGGDEAQSKLCLKCWNEAGLENEHSDTRGQHFGEEANGGRHPDCPSCQREKAADDADRERALDVANDPRGWPVTRERRLVNATATHIKECLVRRGFVLDPRHVEAFMRIEHPTLDALSPEEFSEEVLTAATNVLFAGGSKAEALAKSYGL